jgi:DNA-directed RNA polymerase specialized sigma24 family protein
VLSESDEIERRLNELRQEDDPAEIVVGQEKIDRAFALLSEQERQALTVKIHGFSYEESAVIIFGDPTCARRVEHLLRRARRKVGAAWNELEATGTAPGLDGNASTGDKEVG